jgi:uncharacterized protein (TIGR03083 family)
MVALVTPIREAYLLAAESAAGLLGDPAVAAKWAQPSALEGFTVAGLAGHLASQVLMLPATLQGPPPDGAPIPLLDHYTRVTWIDAGVDAEINVGIRAAGEHKAEAGPEALAADVADTAMRLREALEAAPPDMAVSPPAGPWGLRLDDFLVTRMMEIAVHSDDLAYTVGLPTPELAPSIVEPVLALLTGLAVRRHGTPALLRTLARAERAPAAINAF